MKKNIILISLPPKIGLKHLIRTKRIVPILNKMEVAAATKTIILRMKTPFSKKFMIRKMKSENMSPPQKKINTSITPF